MQSQMNGHLEIFIKFMNNQENFQNRYKDFIFDILLEDKENLLSEENTKSGA